MKNCDDCECFDKCDGYCDDKTMPSVDSYRPPPSAKTKISIYDFINDRVLPIALLLLIGLILFVFGFSGVYAVFADKTARSCSIQESRDDQELKQFTLYADRGWGNISKIGSFSDVNEAFAVAEKMKCHIK